MLPSLSPPKARSKGDEGLTGAMDVQMLKPYQVKSLMIFNGYALCLV